MKLICRREARKHVNTNSSLPVDLKLSTSWGRLDVSLIYLFIYICWSYRLVALILCYNSISPSTFKDDISASAICHLWRFSLVNWFTGRPTMLPLAALVAYPVIFCSTFPHHGYSQQLGGS